MALYFPGVRTGCTLLLSLGVSLLLVSCLSSLRRYQIQHYHFYSQDVPTAFDQYRLSLISDLHVWAPYGNAQAQARQSRFDLERLQEISQLLERQQSQVLLLAGDYVSYRQVVRQDFDLSPYLAKLPQTRDGIVAVLGNHDHFLLPRGKANPASLAFRRAKPNAKAVVLNNQVLQINPYPMPSDNSTGSTDSNQVLYIVGIDDFMFGKRPQQQLLFQGLQAHDFVLALSHNPDSFDLLTQPHLVDLALAGHLHGGQVTLFGLAFSVPAQHKYLRQPYQGRHFPTLVSNGLGASRMQFRIMAPPQIWTIVLHRLEQSPPENKHYWQIERQRLQDRSGLPYGLVVPPKFLDQSYRLIKLSRPAAPVQ